MKKLIYLLCLVLLMASCQKEIDWGSDNPSADNSYDVAGSTVVTSMPPNSRINGYLLDSGIVAVPDSGINLRFDYANVPDNVTWSDSLKTPVNLADYPQARYMVGFSQSLAGQAVTANEYFSLNTTDWNDLGGYFNPAINISQGGFGIDIPQQANKNNPAQTLVKFPVKYKDSINQSVNSSVNLQISGNFSGIPFNGPLTISLATVVNSKNIGYGYLKLKGYPDSLRVVVQRYATSITTTFSSTNFLINTLLATLLSQAGIPNGQTITTTVYRFWAKNKGLVMTREANGMARVRTGL
ncbi:MAG: hypothetical protein HOP10_14990 [Chitinophagaceae bacterium]|nr:hypothetical protein [Chitinophagaceae bacterium]